MRKIFKFCGAPGFERFDWEEARTFDPAALRRRTRASARPLLHYSRRRRNLSRRRGMYGGMPPAAQGKAGPLRGEAFPPPAGAPVDAASGRNGELLLPPAGMSAAASAFLAEAFPRRPSAGNSQGPFPCVGGGKRQNVPPPVGARLWTNAPAGGAVSAAGARLPGFRQPRSAKKGGAGSACVAFRNDLPANRSAALHKGGVTSARGTAL